LAWIIASDRIAPELTLGISSILGITVESIWKLVGALSSSAARPGGVPNRDGIVLIETGQ
jgi:hypothetical protein